MSYELPSGKSPSFVAYGAPETIPAPDGTATTGRPQVYVRWFDSIKILNITDGGRTGKGDTVGIEFDAQSVDFDNKFMAYMNPNDPTLAAIREAYAAGAGIQIALESVRKVKSKSTQEAIPKTTPIHALRGAKQDGSKGSMDASGDNVRNLVAMVDGMPTETINSNPREWKFLSKNRTGEIAPPGWRYVGDKDDWTKLGVVIESAHQTSGGGTMDEGSIAAIAAAVADLLGSNNGGINSNEIAREVRRGVFNEGKPWNARTSNGMVNLGSYLLAKSRAVFIEALAITKNNVEASELTRRILSITDVVQADTYGNNIQADRLAPSHAEAGKWVSFILEQGAAAVYPMDEVSDEQEHKARATARDEWCAKVAASATPLFAGAAQIAREYLETIAAAQKAVAAESVVDPEAAKGSNGEGAEAAEPKAIEASAESATPAIDGPSPQDLLRRLAEALTKTWDSGPSLAALRAPIAAEKMVNAPISLMVVDGVTQVKATFDIEGQDGWENGTVVNFVNRRLVELQNAQGASQVVTPTTEPVQSSASQEAPAVAAEQAQEPLPQSGPAPAAEAAAPAAVAYPAALVAIIDRLKNATADDMGGIFADASSANLLDQRVAAKPVGHSVEFGNRGEVGYLDLPLNQIITRMLENLGASVAADKQTARAEEAATEPEAQTKAPAKSKPAAKTEPESAPVADAAPEGPDFTDDEPNGEDGELSPAQAIADKAQALNSDSTLDAAAKIAVIEKLMEETRAKGLADENIMVGELEGGLQFFLVHLKQETEKALATV
jgi:hypothetical protein